MDMTKGLGRLALAVLPILCIAASRNPAYGAEQGWSVLFEPLFMEAYGHDQHVLTVHERDLGATPTLDRRTPVTLDTESGFAPRFELRYGWEEWGLGLDFFWFDTSQGRPSRTAAAGAVDEVVFEVSDRSFVSDDPGEVLVFEVLEDTDIIAWTIDLYAVKELATGPWGSLDLQLGLRNADFDNDYHSVVAQQDVAGSLLDASSNYPRMMGPVVGLAGEVRLGNGTLRACLGQAFVFGEAELTNEIRDFTGPVSDTPNVVAHELFGKKQDVAIPITEVRLNWLYPIGSHFSLGLSANSSVWWDVPVPPGVIPTSEGDQVFHENTIVYFGVGLAAKLKF